AKNSVLFCVLWLGASDWFAVPSAAQDPRALIRQRMDAAQRAYKETYQLYREGRTRDVDRLYRWSQHWLDAELETSSKKSDQVAAFEGHWNRMKQLEELVRNIYKAGAVPRSELPAVEYYRLDAEIALSKARAQ